MTNSKRIHLIVSVMLWITVALVLSAAGLVLAAQSDITIPFSGHAIDQNFFGATSVYATDLDKDGDMDILGTAADANDITWWENDGSQNFTLHTIYGYFDGARAAYPADVDGDGDVDVLGAAFWGDDIAWWENNGSQYFSRHTIDSLFDGAESVYATDLDGDGDVDVLGAAQIADDITWWKNDGSETFAKHTIDGDFNGAIFVYATDLDKDGDVDVLGAAVMADEIAWWENDGNENFAKHTVGGDFGGALNVFAADVDGDGDVDVLGAASDADEIAWWQNDGSQNFTKQTVDNNFDGAYSVYATDLDGDSDMDILGAAVTADDIVWWQNDGNQNFTPHTLANSFDGARSVFAADVDGDGDEDILGAAVTAGDIFWWEQEAVQPLTVAGFPFYDGFETGTLSSHWSTFTTREGRVQVITSTYPYSGSYALALDDSQDNTVYSRAAATLNINLSGQAQVDLEFRWRKFDDENNEEDGVFISDDDGATWHRVLSFNDGTGDWQHSIVDIDAAAAANGLTLNDHFQIRFQFYDNAPLNTDGYVIDEVKVSSASSPAAIAGLTAASDSPTYLGTETTLTATITAGSNVAYTWNFGDGATGSGKLVAHTYPAAGQYTAVVTATNSENSATATTNITINEPPLCQQFDFGSAGVGYGFYGSLSWNFTAPYNMHVNSIETLSWLSASILGQFTIEARVNGETVASWGNINIVNLYGVTRSAQVSKAVKKGDTVTYYIKAYYPAGGIGYIWGPNYIKLCSLPNKISISDVVVTEGDSGSTPAVFTVTMSPASTQTVTVDYLTVNGSATAPTDYTAIATTTLTFAPNETTKQISVDVQGDETVESDETFWVNLSNPVNAGLADATGQGTILNNDAPNQPPATPSSPSPTDGATDVPTHQVLSWQSSDPDGDGVTYTVAFGTANPPPVITTTAQARYTPNLITNTTYYWAITATDGLSTTNGATWSFTTSAATSSGYNVYLPAVLKQ